MDMRRPKTEPWKGWHEKKRQRKKRDLPGEGKGGREISWRMHLGGSKTLGFLSPCGDLMPPHRVE